MMNIKHETKKVTLEIPEFKITLKINVYGRTYMGNPSGFYAKVEDDKGNSNRYHVNVLDSEIAMFRGIQRFMKEFHGVGYLTTILPFHAANWVDGYRVIVLDAKSGKFTINGSCKYWLEDVTNTSDEEMGLTRKEVRGEDWDSDFSLGMVMKWEKDDVWTVMHMDTTREHTDPIIAAAQMICLTV
jgi:hypothetical protein